MLRSTATFLTKRFRVTASQPHTVYFSTSPQTTGRKWGTNNEPGKETRNELDRHGGPRTARKKRINHLIRTLPDLGDSKEAIYGALDAWVVWEEQFPIGALKNVLLSLEREKHWHRIIQVLKWMMSKGQGDTIRTYHQLIKALDEDNRAEEAHNFWMKKIGNDLHSVPWDTCNLMISVYFKNGMFDRLVKLFKCLETFDRKPPVKSTLQKVAYAYEKLGFIDDKTRLLEKYDDVLSRETKEYDKKPKRRGSSKIRMRKRPSSFSEPPEA